MESSYFNDPVVCLFFSRSFVRNNMMASSQGSKKTKPFADDYELSFEYKANSNLSKSKCLMKHI